MPRMVRAFSPRRPLPTDRARYSSSVTRGVKLLLGLTALSLIAALAIPAFWVDAPTYSAYASAVQGSSSSWHS